MKIPRTAKTHRLLFVISHITFILYCFLFGPIYFFVSLLLGLIVYNVSVQLFMHRSMSHGHFSFSPSIRRGLCVLFSLCNFGSLAINCGTHIQHHKFSDTKLDPHNFQILGIWKTLMKDWDKSNFPPFSIYRPYLTDKIVLSQHKNNLNYAVFASIFLPFIPVCSFWLVNLLIIVVHLGSSPVNIPILFPLMWGEEFHKVHHDYPGKKKLHFFDFTYFLGTLLGSNISTKYNDYINKEEP